ncbi:hypothetical protein, partial [Actinomadura kijaniata]|uniref:hypothetical protein n=1 Tax=Actinomadura kijaniata TaxID=46161 RepID=UPI0031CF4BD8
MPLDVNASWESVKEAWAQHVPPGQGTAEELTEEVRADLLTLQTLLAEPAGAAPTAASLLAEDTTTLQISAAPPGSTEGWKASAAAVNDALRQADGHAPDLHDLPEWQHIQTVRGAFGHLWKV